MSDQRDAVAGEERDVGAGEEPAAEAGGDRGLADEFAARRGRSYPAHRWIAERFPEYVETMLQLDEIIRRRPRRFDEKGHELFHIVALAVMGSNPHNQPHLTAHIKKALELGAHPEEIAEALMVAVNPAGARVLTYGVTCMLEAIEQLEAEGWALVEPATAESGESR